MANTTTSGHGSQGGVEGIAELLRCYICMEGLTDATICPHCSKLGCFACIERWVTNGRSDCPHCRMTLTARDLIRIPLFDDLGEFLETLRSKKSDAKSTSPRNGHTHEKCTVHKQKLTVYCDTCRKCICHECALWTDEHHGHSFKPLDDLYKKHMEVLKRELLKLKERMKDVMTHVQQVEKKMEAVKVSKSKTRRDIYSAVDKVYCRLDDQAKAKLAKLGDSRHHLRSQAVEIAQTSHELEKKMNEEGIALLVDTNGELKQELRQSLQKLHTSSLQMDVLPSVGDYINEVIPDYDSALFKISPFKELQQHGEEIYSRPLKVCGLTWRLKVYPNGHREDFGNYLAVFVELTEGFDRTTTYQYCIEMLYQCSNKYPQKNYKREYASDFSDGESWGYKKYYELAKLQENGFMKENTVILKFSVRAPSYHQKCKDLSSYIDNVENERDALQTQLQNARSQVTALKTENKAIATGRSHASPSHSSNTRLISSSQQECSTSHNTANARPMSSTQQERSITHSSGGGTIPSSQQERSSTNTRPTEHSSARSIQQEHSSTDARPTEHRSIPSSQQERSSTNTRPTQHEHSSARSIPSSQLQDRSTTHSSSTNARPVPSSQHEHATSHSSSSTRSIPSTQQERSSTHLAPMHHGSHHQHSHSDPHDHHQHPHHRGGGASSSSVERERQRMETEEARRYLSVSQQPLRTHHPHTSSHSHQSPKRPHYMPPHTGHADSRMMGNDPPPHLPPMMYVDRQRRSSHEDTLAGPGRIGEQRRRSADPAVLVNFDHSSPPFPRGGHSVFPRELSQSHPELLPPHSITSAETGETMENHYDHSKREQQSKSSSSSHGSRKVNRQVKKSSPKPSEALIKTNALPSFDDSESSEGGSSQSCETISQSDIQLVVEDDKNTLKSASSTSTLISVGNSPPRNGSNNNQQRKNLQQLSQEQFGDEDHTEMMSLATLAAVPQSSQPMYYDFEMQDSVPPLPFLVKTELAQGDLSPYTVSPPKSRHGKSLTDLSNSGSNSNLTYSQSLSQSVVDMPYYFTREMHNRYEAMPHAPRAYIKAAHSHSHGHLHQMSSDPHLNADGPPGLSMTMAAALTNLREEVELKQHSRQQQRRPMYHGHTHKQHSRQQRRQVTVIPEERIKPNISEKSVMTTPKVEVTAAAVVGSPTVPEPKSSPTSSARRLTLGGKSDSTSSLSMEIL